MKDFFKKEALLNLLLPLIVLAIGIGAAVVVMAIKSCYHNP